MPAICSARWLSGGSRTGVIAQCNSAVVATTVGLVGVGEVGIGAGRRGQWRLRIEPRLQPAPGSNQAGSGYDRDQGGRHRALGPCQGGPPPPASSHLASSRPESDDKALIQCQPRPGSFCARTATDRIKRFLRTSSRLVPSRALLHLAITQTGVLYQSP
jgi:hypothetical protein